MILLDIDNPAMGGGRVAREMQEDPALGLSPILCFTSPISAAEAGQEVVVNDGLCFLAKSVNPKVFVEAVNSVLGGIASAA